MRLYSIIAILRNLFPSINIEQNYPCRHRPIDSLKAADIAMLVFAYFLAVEEFMISLLFYIRVSAFAYDYLLSLMLLLPFSFQTFPLSFQP